MCFTWGMETNRNKETAMSTTVWTLTTQSRENCDGMEGIGVSVWASYELAIHALASGIVDDNHVEADPLEGDDNYEQGPDYEEARAMIVETVINGKRFASAFDEYSETDWDLCEQEVGGA